MALTPNMRGAMFMTGSQVAFTINDAFMKLLSADFPFFQLLCLRSLATVLFIAFLAWRADALRIPPSRTDRQLIGIRTIAEAAAAYFFLNALFNMPIANVTAIIQALPLTVTLGAAFFLKEPVGWRRFVAIGIGFVGVMLIVRPGGDGFTIYSIYALLAVVCVTIRDLAVRRMSDTVPTLTVAVAAALGVLAFGVAGALFVDWQPMDGRDLLYLAVSVISVIGAYLFSIMTMRVGEIGFVAPFRYTSLLAALVFGLVIFGEWPDVWTQVGAVIVVATGLFTLWRERKSSGKAPLTLRMR